MTEITKVDLFHLLCSQLARLNHHKDVSSTFMGVFFSLILLFTRVRKIKERQQEQEQQQQQQQQQPQQQHVQNKRKDKAGLLLNEFTVKTCFPTQN